MLDTAICIVQSGVLPKPRKAMLTEACEAGLRYVTANVPGIRRLGKKPAFRYKDAHNREVVDARVLRRIQALAIPPAWKDVWICADSLGHLQATGLDARGRKQYRYHRLWREARDENNFDRMIDFGLALPAIRRRVRKDIRRRGLGREKVVASVVRLLELTAARIGNEQYASENQSYGLTTLRDSHARIGRRKLQLQYVGKGGKRNTAVLEHARLSRIVERCRSLPGRRLFQYVDEKTGEPQPIHSQAVNQYLAEVSGGSFSAKDFRTWTGTVAAAMALCEGDPAGSKAQSTRRIKRALRQVAERLGNTPAICRKCYVHRAIIRAYIDGTLTWGFPRPRGPAASRTGSRLRPEERAVIALLKKRKKVHSGRPGLSKLVAGARRFDNRCTLR